MAYFENKRKITAVLKTPGGSVVRIHLPTQETQVQSLGRENPPEKEMAMYSSAFAWEVPWKEEPGGLQSMGSPKSWT